MTPVAERRDLVAAFRPSDSELEEAWPVASRVAMAERIRASAPSPVRRRPVDHPARWRSRRWALSAGLIAAAAAVVLIVQAMLPSGTPAGPSNAAAATLEQLATPAQVAAPDLARPGQFRYLVDQESSGETQESWTSYTGETWRRDTYYNGVIFYWHFPAGTNNLNNPSPQFLATLPTSPSTLKHYLREHVSGSTSTNEAVFTRVGDTLRLGFAPPALRAAAFRVLKMTPHIIVQPARDQLGRQAVEVRFVDQARRPGESQTLFFDPTTSQLLQEQDAMSGGTFTAVYSHDSVVGAVPAPVITGATKPNTNPPPPPLPGGSMGGATSASATASARPTK